MVFRANNSVCMAHYRLSALWWCGHPWSVLLGLRSAYACVRVRVCMCVWPSQCRPDGLCNIFPRGTVVSEQHRVREKKNEQTHRLIIPSALSFVILLSDFDLASRASCSPVPPSCLCHPPLTSPLLVCLSLPSSITPASLLIRLLFHLAVTGGQTDRTQAKESNVCKLHVFAFDKASWQQERLCIYLCMCAIVCASRWGCVWPFLLPCKGRKLLCSCI